MVYATAARKTLGYMVLSGVLALSVMTFLTGDVGATGRVVDETTGGVSGWSAIVFALGVFTGALMVGTYVYVAHLEAKR